MKRSFSILSVLFALTMVSFGQPIDAAQPFLSKSPATDPSQTYSKAQIRALSRNAHTLQQYTTLADYYATQKRMYARKAGEAMHLWAQRSATITPLSEKWPRPVDSARNLHDYYAYSAARAEGLRAKYDRLADLVQ